MKVLSGRCIISFLCCVICSCVWMNSAKADDVVDRIVAVVNGKIITLFDVNQQLRGYSQQFEGRTMTSEEKKSLEILRQKILGQMVNDLLLLNEAQRLEMIISDVEVKNQVEAFKKKQGMSEDVFLTQLTLQGMDRKDYEEKVKHDIMRQRLIGAMVRRKVVVTEKEMKEYYEAHMQEFSQEKKIELGLILVDAGFDLAGLRDKILAGTISFPDAATKYSLGPGADQGGNLGVVRWVDLGEEWKDALRDLGKGDISSIFDLNGNQAMLFVKEYAAGDVAPYEEVKDKIRDILYRPRIEKRYEEYMDGLRSKAVMDIRM